MTSGVWSVAKHQRYSSAVLSKPLDVPIVAVLIWSGSCLHPIWSKQVVKLPALPAVAGLSVVMRRPALLGIPAGDTKENRVNGHY